MKTAGPIDSRLSSLTQHLKSMASPQALFSQKAGEVRSERIDGVVTLYRHEDVVKFNRHPAVLGQGGRGGSLGNDNKLIPLEIDGEEHRSWRRILDPMFSPKRVAFLEDSVRQLAGELIDKFVADGQTELSESYCVPLPCLTFLRFVGAPVDDLDFFLEFKDGVLHPQGETQDEINATMALAGGKLLEYFSNFLVERRKETEPEQDIIAALMHSELDGEPLTDMQLLNVLFLFMFAGLDTVTGTMSCIYAWLAQHPEERDRLVADPSLIPAAVEEIIRYESPVPQAQRYAEDDVDLGGGLVITAGEGVFAIWAAANVDPTMYSNPLEVNFERGRTNHIVFGSGTHRCLGSHLARLELRIATEELLKRIPDFQVSALEELVYDNVAVRAATRLPITFTPQS